MAEYKISDLTAHPNSKLGDSDLVEVSYYSGGVYYSRKLTGIQLKKCKTWKGTITQSGTSAPTVTVNYNDLSGTITWAYSAVGVYTGTLTGEFTAAKTHIYIQAQDEDNIAFAKWTDANTITITTCNKSLAKTNGLLNAASLTIEVYP